MIVHPGARTRALYHWEKTELDKFGKRFRSEGGAQRFVEEVWEEEGWHLRHSCPEVQLRRITGPSFNEGRSLIVLDKPDWHTVTSLHELTHARGFGEGKIMHTVTFVKQYLYMLAKYAGMDHTYLCFQATARGLI